MPQAEQVYMRVRIGTADVSDHVWRIDVEDIDRGCDKLTLQVVDPNSGNADALAPGQRVEVELGWELEKALVFEGVIRVVNPIAGDKHRMEVVAFDLSSLLAATPAKDAPPLDAQFTGTLNKVLTDILSRYAIPIGAITIDPMPVIEQDKPLRRENRTDLQLVMYLAELYRSRAFVEVNVVPTDAAVVVNKGGTSRFYFVSEAALLAQEPMGTLKFCRGFSQLLEFDYKRVGSGASPSTSSVISDPKTGQPIALEAEPVAEIPPNTPDSQREARAEAVQGSGAQYAAGVQAAGEDAVQRPSDLLPVRVATGLPSDEAAAEAAIKKDRTRTVGLHGRGVAMGTVFLRAKGCVNIEGLASWSAGKWYVTRVNHLVERHTIRIKDKDTTRYTFRSKFVATR